MSTEKYIIGINTYLIVQDTNGRMPLIKYNYSNLLDEKRSLVIEILTSFGESKIKKKPKVIQLYRRKFIDG